MDFLKRLINPYLPQDMIPATAADDPNFKPPMSNPPLDLDAPENTGFRNLLATINMNRDPATGQIDPRRQQDNMSFAGMNETPFNLEPNIKMMPEQDKVLAEAIQKQAASMPAPAPVVKAPVVAKKSSVPLKDIPKPDAPKAEVPKELSIDEQLAEGSKKPDKDQEMVDALEQRRKNLLLLGLGKAAQQIGAGIGGSKVDENYGDNLKDLANMPVTNLKEARAAQEALDKRDQEHQKFVMDKIGFKTGQELKGLELQKAKMGLADEAMRSDPKSDSSMLARFSTRDALMRMGRKDLASKINDNMNANQIDKLFGTMNLSNMTTAYEAQQNRLELAKQTAAIKGAAYKDKMDEKDIKRLDAAGKLLDAPLQRTNTTIGKLAAIKSAAGRVRQLIAGQTPDQVTNQQLYELARSVDAMVTQGASTISGTEHLLPVGWKTKYAKMAETLKNKPVGAGQGPYVVNIMHTIDREEKEADRQIKEGARGTLGPYMDLAKKNPEAWNTMLKMKGIDPADINLSPEEPPMSADGKPKYSMAQEAGIKAVMDGNGISRSEAIKALKDAGKL